VLIDFDDRLVTNSSFWVLTLKVDANIMKWKMGWNGRIIKLSLSSILCYSYHHQKLELTFSDSKYARHFFSRSSTNQRFLQFLWISTREIIG
jgi:hypothetical protein